MCASSGGAPLRRPKTTRRSQLPLNGREPLKRCPRPAHSFFAAGKRPTQIDAVEAFLYRAMGFDKAHMGVHGQILSHRRVGVEPYRRQATALGLADGMIHELAPQTFALPRRVDRDVVDEVGIG